MGKPHREICALCHEVSRVGFSVPDKIWRAAIHRHYQEDIICLRCFARLADEKSVEWDKNIELYPVSWITHNQVIEQEETDSAYYHYGIEILKGL